MARTIAEHWSEFVLTGFQDGDTWTQMVIMYRLADVELICLGSTQLVPRTVRLSVWLASTRVSSLPRKFRADGKFLRQTCNTRQGTFIAVATEWQEDNRLNT
jgi:hypothetical protein